MRVVNTGICFARMAALLLLGVERLGIQATSKVNLISFRYYLNRFKAAYRQTLIGKYLKLVSSQRQIYGIIMGNSLKITRPVWVMTCHRCVIGKSFDLSWTIFLAISIHLKTINQNQKHVVISFCRNSAV